MDVHALFTDLAAQVSATSLWEWIAVIFGIAQVLLAWKNNVWLYPAGIISTGFSIALLASVRLYAEAFLNAYYLVMSVYGWWHWLRMKGTAQLPITRSNRSDWVITILISGLGWILLYCLLRNFTPSDVPAWDALVSSTAWAGMWLLARRKLENWILLNVSNLLAIPLQFHKHIPVYALLTAVLFVVAIFGYFNWKKIMKSRQTSLP